MSARWIVLMLLLAGLVKGLPVVGVLSGSVLERLYGLSITDPDLVTLMRHRAVLFGLLGTLLISSIFVTLWRSLAITAGLVSLWSYCALAWMQGDASPALMRLFWIDLVTSVGLASAGVLHWRIGKGDF